MTEGTTDDTDRPVTSITGDRLHERIEAGDDVFVLDVRNEEDFEEWRVDGENVEIVNYPYFQLMDGITGDLVSRLPQDEQITVLCAKGGSSEMVAALLEDEGYDVDHLEHGMKGWARVYEYVELDVDVAGTIAQYRRPSSGCLAYQVVSGGDAAVVDPLRAFTKVYVGDARALGADVTYALDTHVHADHVSGIRELARRTDATAVLPEPAAERGVTSDGPSETVADGDVLTVGDVEIEAAHAPGHTRGMTAYRVGKVLFTGDGLFVESVARPDLEEPEAARDAARTLYENLTDRILSHPDDTVVAPGHVGDSVAPTDDGSYTVELGDRRASVTALSMDEEAFVESVVSGLPPRPANHEEIVAANLERSSPDDEVAFELELGPNNCAASEEGLAD